MPHAVVVWTVSGWLGKAHECFVQWVVAGEGAGEGMPSVLLPGHVACWAAPGAGSHSKWPPATPLPSITPPPLHGGVRWDKGWDPCVFGASPTHLLTYNPTHTCN